MPAKLHTLCLGLAVLTVSPASAAAGQDRVPPPAEAVPRAAPAPPVQAPAPAPVEAPPPIDPAPVAEAAPPPLAPPMPGTAPAAPLGSGVPGIGARRSSTGVSPAAPPAFAYALNIYTWLDVLGKGGVAEYHYLRQDIFLSLGRSDPERLRAVGRHGYFGPNPVGAVVPVRAGDNYLLFPVCNNRLDWARRKLVRVPARQRGQVTLSCQP